MKKVGLVGGIGPESTILYYHDIVYGVERKLPHKFPPLVIESVNVFDVFSFCEEKKHDELSVYMSQAIHKLFLAGADFAAMTGNTPHIIFEQLQEQSPIPLISIVNETYKVAKSENLSKVLLLGTPFTMRESFFKEPFQKNGIQVIVPSEKEIDYIGDKISSELEVGIVNETTQKKFIQIIEKFYKKEHVESVILGCTELPLLFSGTILSIPYLDTMKIHINAIIDAILK